MSTTANFDGSICGLCKEKINKGTEIENFDNAWCHEKCVKAQGSTDTTPPAETPTVTNKVEAPKPQSRPEMNPNLKAFVAEEAIVMLQIQTVCREILGLGTTGQQLGLWTKEIYRESKKVKFEKP
jgi:hypothetical protein